MEEGGGLNLYSFVRNSPTEATDLLGLFNAAAFYYDTSGELNEISSTTAASAIRLDHDIPAEDGRHGMFDIVHLSNRVTTKGLPEGQEKGLCFIRVLYVVRINEAYQELGENAPNGAIDAVRYHYFNGTRRLSAWGKRLNSQNTQRPARGATIAHERGHARAYIEHVQSLLNALNDMFTEEFDDWSDDAMRTVIQDRVNGVPGGWYYQPQAHRSQEYSAQDERAFYQAGWTQLTGASIPQNAPQGTDEVWQK